MASLGELANAELDWQLPTGRGFIALLEALRATGGTVPGDVVGRLLEEHQVGNLVSLAKLVHTGQVFGFEWRASLWIPMFQFNGDDLSLKPAAQWVRAELPSLWSGWTVACWFAAANPALKGYRPADLLDSDPVSVLLLARSLGQQEVAGGMALPSKVAPRTYTQVVSPLPETQTDRLPQESSAERAVHGRT